MWRDTLKIFKEDYRNTTQKEIIFMYSNISVTCQNDYDKMPWGILLQIK